MKPSAARTLLAGAVVAASCFAALPQIRAGDFGDAQQAIKDFNQATTDAESSMRSPDVRKAENKLDQAEQKLGSGGGSNFAALAAAGQIKIESVGTGETIGHIADLKIDNLTDQPINCVVGPMILESKSRKNQDYVCSKPQTVKIDPHRTTTVPMDGVCVNRNKPPVGKGAPGDLIINTGDRTLPQNPDSHIPASQARDLLRICTSKYEAADKLQKDGALKNLPYKDKQKQKDIVVQWSTWCDPRISEITGAPPATKDDLKKVVYKQVEAKGKMSPETKKKVDQGIDTIFEKVELTTAKAKDVEKPEPLLGGAVTTGKPGPFFKPATVAQPGDIAHVEDKPRGGNGHWAVKVKLPSGEIVEVWFESDEPPPLEFCNTIKINKTHTSSPGHNTIVDDYLKNPSPTPTEDHEKTKALTPTPTPTATSTAAPTATPTPCTEDETHDLSSETKEFKILDPDGTPIFQCYTNKDSAIAAGNGLSEYFKNGAKIADKMKEHLPPGVGTTVAGWLVGYIKGGSQILDAVLASRLKTAGVSSVTVAVDLPIKVIKATCTTYKICIHGVWVTKKKYSESVEHERLKESKTADSNNQSNGEWEKVCDDSSRYDAAKAEAWAKQFLDDHLTALDKAEKDYQDFKDKCK